MTRIKPFKWKFTDFKLLDRVQLDFIKKSTFEPAIHSPWGTIIHMGGIGNRIRVFHYTPTRDYLVDVLLERIIARRRDDTVVVVRECRSCETTTLHTIAMKAIPWRVCTVCGMEQVYALERLNYE